MRAGALKKAAENARKDGKKVGCYIVETFGKDATPQELSDVLRLEYRSKLLNPKWAKVQIFPSFFSLQFFLAIANLLMLHQDVRNCQKQHS